MKASAYLRRQPIRNVSLPGALEGFPWPMTNGLELGWRGIPVSQYRRRHRHPIWSSIYSFFVPTSVAPYSIIPSVMNWRFCGVLSNYHFGPREAGKSLMNSLSRNAFNAPNTCRSFVGPIPDVGVTSSSVHFFSPIYTVLPPHFPPFHLCWLLRKRQRETIACYSIALASINISSATSYSISLQSFLQSIF